MTYTTIYNLPAAQTPIWWLLLYGLLFAAIAVALYLGRNLATIKFMYWPFSAERVRIIYPIVWGCLGVLMVLSWIASFEDQFADLREAVSSGHYTEVAGRISGFHEWVPHQLPESFSVGDVQIAFWPTEDPGFSDTSYPFRNGECVRIWSVESTIVRVEVGTGNTNAPCMTRPDI
jgi:hypothetical protein